VAKVELRLAGDEHAIGVLGFDRAAEIAVLVRERRELVAVELIESGLLRLAAERRQCDRFHELDRGARPAPAAASAPAAPERRGRLIIVYREIAEPDLVLAAYSIRQVARCSRSMAHHAPPRSTASA